MATLLHAAEQRNDAAANLRNTDAGDLLELRVALREADSRPSIAQAGVFVVRALLLLLGEPIVDIIPHQIQMSRLIERLLGAEMEIASLSWSKELLDTVDEILREGS